MTVCQWAGSASCKLGLAAFVILVEVGGHGLLDRVGLRNLFTYVGQPQALVPDRTTVLSGGGFLASTVLTGTAALRIHDPPLSSPPSTGFWPKDTPDDHPQASPRARSKGEGALRAPSPLN